ncbi:hypothetical protein ACFWAT_31760 [Streptomyces syringium]|uniref:hypothetical protein n=1 Tax=Streptomyces syringium TaxID=76729 RepID=UPI0036648B1F
MTLALLSGLGACGSDDSGTADSGTSARKQGGSSRADASGSSNSGITARSGGNGNGEPSPVPEVLIGEWCGGSNHTPEGHWTYSFSRSGKFMARNPIGGVRSGFFGTSGNTMAVKFEGQSDSVMSKWRVENSSVGEILFINEFSYVRGSCES